MARQIDKTQKRQEILSAALRVFADKGFKNTKIIDIAQQAGIGKGTVYEYFRSKDEMLLAAFDAYQAEMQGAVTTILAGDYSPLTKIQMILNSSFDIFARDVSTMGLMFDFWLVGKQNEDQFQIDFKPIYREYRELIQQLLDAGIEAKEVREDIPPYAAAVIVAVVEGMFLQWIVDPEIFDVKVSKESVLNMIENGLAI